MVTRKPNGPRKRGKASPRDRFYMSGTPNIVHAIGDVNAKLVDTAAVMRDEDQAREHLVQITSSGFLGRHGGKMARIRSALELVVEELETTQARLKDLQERELHTPQWVHSAAVNQTRHDQTRVDVPFGAWRLPHRIEAWILIVMLLVAFVASYFTAYSNLRGSGAPIFIETPIAWLMAAMAPLAGLALKLLGNVFTSDRGHRRYTLTLFLTAITLAVGWAGLFATLYHGLSADGVGGGIFDEPTLWDEVKDTAFVFVTILTEIFIAAALASRLDRIARIYSPDQWEDNPESLTINQAIQDLQKKIERLTRKKGKLEQSLAPLQSGLELQTGTTLLGFDNRTERMSNSDFI